MPNLFGPIRCVARRVALEEHRVGLSLAVRAKSRSALSEGCPLGLADDEPVPAGSSCLRLLWDPVRMGLECDRAQ